MFNGDPLAETAKRVHELGVEVVLINCARPAIAAGAFGVLAETLPKANLGLYPNLLEQNVSPDGFANWMKGFAARASVLGGCCGTTPEHIAALHQVLVSETAR